MIYIFVVFLGLLLFWAILVYIRKTMWDAVHRNLLDLEDNYEGRVMRRSFASRPFFHGKIEGTTITINFSSERTAGKRFTYIDISYEKAASMSLTITDGEWLKKQNPGPLKDFVVVKNKLGREYIIRPASDKKVKKLLNRQTFEALLNDLPGLAYIYSGGTGLICELFTDEVIKATEFKEIKKYLQLLQQLSEVLH